MRNGATPEKVEAALGDYKKSPLFSTREKLALELCERMTYTNKRVTDRFFNRLKRNFSEEELVELAAVIALDREEQGPGGASAVAEMEREQGMRMIALVNVREMLEFLERERLPGSTVAAIRKYQAQYGVQA